MFLLILLLNSQGALQTIVAQVGTLPLLCSTQSIIATRGSRHHDWFDVTASAPLPKVYRSSLRLPLVSEPQVLL